jgi:chromosome segregation ATPase
MAKNLRRQLSDAQARVAEGNENISRLRATIEYLKRSSAPSHQQEQELKAMVVRHRLNMVELNRLIEQATPAVPMPDEVIPLAARTASRPAQPGQPSRSA